jgi:hypothetical protein
MSYISETELEKQYLDSDIPDNPNVGNADKAFIDFLRKANLEKEQRLIVMTERIRSLEAQLATAQDRLREAEELHRRVIDADKTVDDLLAAGDMLSTLAHEAKAYFAKYKGAK